MRNSALRGAALLEAFQASLAETGTKPPIRAARRGSSDARLTWEVNSVAITLDIEIKQTSVTSRAQARQIAAKQAATSPVLIAPFISRAAQDEMKGSGWSYWDDTGNMLIQNKDPFIWIERAGATRDPSPDKANARGLRSLKGQSASIVITKLLTEQSTVSIRELARTTGVGVGTVSRVLALLRDDELIVEEAGAMFVVDRGRLVDRWVQDYSYTKTFTAQRYYSVLGDDIAIDRILNSDLVHAVTGVRAAKSYLAEMGEIVTLPASDIWTYVPDIKEAEEAWQLIPERKGSIVVAECTFLQQEEVRLIDDIPLALPWRVAGDLMSTTGRTASVGAQLVDALTRMDA